MELKAWHIGIGFGVIALGALALHYGDDDAPKKDKTKKTAKDEIAKKTVTIATTVASKPKVRSAPPPSAPTATPTQTPEPKGDPDFRPEAGGSGNSFVKVTSDEADSNPGNILDQLAAKARDILPAT